MELFLIIAGVASIIGLFILRKRSKTKQIIKQSRSTGNITQLSAGDQTTINISSNRDLEESDIEAITKRIREQHTSYFSDNLADLKMRLLDDIRSESKVSTMLLSAIDVAKSSGREEDLRWMQNELFGYGQTREDGGPILNRVDDSMFPRYRRIKSTFYLAEPTGRLLPFEYKLAIGHSIPEIEYLIEKRDKAIRSASPQTKDTLSVTISMPEDIRSVFSEVASMSDKITLYINPDDFEKILHSVKKKIKRFYAEI